MQGRGQLLRCPANALEDNVTIYHTIMGKRTEKKRVEMNVRSGQWHTLRVDFHGSHFSVTFDGKKALEWEDETFKDAAKWECDQGGQRDAVR